jgi:riboflavin-specific deaminase-like protein
VDDWRPRVTVKIAQTVDGRVATSAGESRWITGPEARAAGHVLRAEHDAILVGIGTVLADDPALTVRHVTGRDPLRIVLDSTLRTPSTAHVLRTGVGRALLLCGEDAPVEREAALIGAGTQVLRVATDARQVALPAALTALRKVGVRSVLVEGGPTVVTAFLRARFVDRVAIFIAPMVLGTGRDAVGDLGVTQLAEAIRGTVMSVERVGDDLLVRIDVLRSSA